MSQGWVEASNSLATCPVIYSLLTGAVMHETCWWPCPFCRDTVPLNWLWRWRSLVVFALAWRRASIVLAWEGARGSGSWPWLTCHTHCSDQDSGLPEWVLFCLLWALKTVSWNFKFMSCFVRLFLNYFPHNGCFTGEQGHGAAFWASSPDWF